MLLVRRPQSFLEPNQQPGKPPVLICPLVLSSGFSMPSLAKRATPGTLLYPVTLPLWALPIAMPLVFALVYLRRHPVPCVEPNNSSWINLGGWLWGCTLSAPPFPWLGSPLPSAGSPLPLRLALTGLAVLCWIPGLPVQIACPQPPTVAKARYSQCHGWGHRISHSHLWTFRYPNSLQRNCFFLALFAVDFPVFAAMATVVFYPHIFTGSVGRRIRLVVPVDTLCRTSIISSSTVLPLNPLVNLSLAPLSLFLTYGPDFGVWPDCWVSRKGLGSTTTTHEHTNFYKNVSRKSQLPIM